MEHVHYLHCTLEEGSNCSCVDPHTNTWQVQMSSLLQPKPGRLWKSMAEARPHRPCNKTAHDTVVPQLEGYQTLHPLR